MMRPRPAASELEDGAGGVHGTNVPAGTGFPADGTLGGPSYSSFVKRRAGAIELLDGPLDPDVLAGNLRDLARTNHWLGGTAISRRALLTLVRIGGRTSRASRNSGDGDGEVIRLLDVGTGLADIPAALIDWTARHGLHVRVEAVDARPEIVDVARRRFGDRADLALGVATGAALPFPDRGFDISHASLVLHHLEPDDAVRVLREMRRVSRVGVIVNDLDRSFLAWLAAWIGFRSVTRNRYTRHDGPLSVRRAYHPGEIAALAARAGLVEVARVAGPFRHRWALAFVPTGSGGADDGA